MKASNLETAILQSLDNAANPVEWLPVSISELRTRLKDIDAVVVNAKIEQIAEAMISLAQDGYVLLGKRERGDKRLPFDFQRQFDAGYIDAFFARNRFEIKLTHVGHTFLASQLHTRATPAEMQDRRFAQLAIQEARMSIPETDNRPHPLVGAVVVKNGIVLAAAHRGEAEGNHAEYIALERKLSDAALSGATVYTTLEPCTTRNHPKVPCAKRLIDRKVARVVIGMLDPDPRITGRGQRMLRSANIITDFFPHDLMSEAEELNRTFTRAIEEPTTAVPSSRPSLISGKLEKHRNSILKQLDDITKYGLVQIGCDPVQSVDLSVPDLEEFIQRNRFQFSEAMKHFQTVDVFQNGISVGYARDRNNKTAKSSIRFTIYRTGFTVFDGLIDTFLGQEVMPTASGSVARARGLHAGWLSYEVQRHLQLVKQLLSNSRVREVAICVEFENLERFPLNVPAAEGNWLRSYDYRGPHESIYRQASLSEVNSHDGDKRNIASSVVVDVLDEVFRIFGQSKAQGLWDDERRLSYVRGLENVR